MVWSLIQSGIPIGSAAAALGLPAIIIAYGWHAAYALLAALSLLWCALWLVVSRDNESERTASLIAVPVHRVPLARLLLNSTVLGVMLASFAGYALLTLSLIWLPAYLQIALGLSAKDAGTVLTAAWLVQVLLYPAAGCFSNLLRRRGFSVEIACGTFGALGVALSGVALAGIAFASPIVDTIVLVPLAVASIVIIGVIGPPMLAEVVPPAQFGTTLGAVVAVYAVSGFIAPILFGGIIDAGGGSGNAYRAAFIVSGTLVAGTAVLAAALMKPTADRRALESG